MTPATMPARVTEQMTRDDMSGVLRTQAATMKRHRANKRTGGVSWSALVISHMNVARGEDLGELKSSR